MEVLFEFHKNGELKYSELEKDYNKTLEIIESLEYKNMLSNEGIKISRGKILDYKKMMFYF